MTDSETRRMFNTVIASKIGAERWGKPVPQKGLSKRFAYFDDGKTFTVVGGIQEGEEVQRALALGLSYRKNRPLRLVLPDSHLHATQMRLGWVEPGIVSLWSHNGVNAHKTRQPSEDTLLSRLGAVTWPKPTPSLSKRATVVGSLANWIDALSDVQPAHRQDYRAWQCRGRGVLRIERRKSCVRIAAGVNSPGYEHGIFELESAPDSQTLQEIERLVVAAIEQRLGEQDARHMDAENWLQSVLRERPEKLGLAEPVIRELAAWRPRSHATDPQKAWGRGFIDLVGLDSLGGKVFLDSTRAGNATVVAVYSPRLPVSFPVSWDDLGSISPADFTIRSAPQHLANADSWAQQLGAPQQLSSDLIEEGRLIPIARVQAMHEGKRRARARKEAASDEESD